MKITSVSFMLVAILLAVGFSAAAQKGTRPAPDRVVANLYKQHKTRSPFFQTRSRALVDKYFDKHLADLIWKDAKTSKGEVGALDGDPLYNAQDMEIKNFSIHPPTLSGGTAEVKVSFKNFNEPHVITYQLVLTRSGWKIANIKYDDGADLVGILKGNSN